MAANGANRVPVAAAIASASVTSEAAAVKSPRQVVRIAIEFTKIVSWASKPASRQH